jgi:hypothetical protein
MRSATRKEIEKAAVGKAATTRKDAMARSRSRTIGLPGAVRRKTKMTVTVEMVKRQASRSSREQLKPCALTEVPPCTPLTTNSNSGHDRSM